MTKSALRLVLALAFSISSILIGIAGFMFLEGFNLRDAFYMTVITISTVGFNEVQPLSETGRIFTSFFIILNFGIFAYVISVITTYLFEGELRKVYRNIMIGREVKRMKNHTIICGFGRNGLKAAEELYNSNEDFIIVERDVDIINAHRESTRYQFIAGDSTLDETLEDAGIGRAKAIITSLPNDSDNVFISLTAKEMNPEIFVIARASEEQSEQKLYRVGADRVVLPDALGGLQMAQLLTKPYVIEFLDLINGIGMASEDTVLEELEFADLKDEYRNKTIKDLDIHNETGASILAFKDHEKGFQFSPDPSTVVTDGDILLVLGSKSAVKKIKSHYNR